MGMLASDVASAPIPEEVPQGTFTLATFCVNVGSPSTATVLRRVSFGMYLVSLARSLSAGSCSRLPTLGSLRSVVACFRANRVAPSRCVHHAGTVCGGPRGHHVSQMPRLRGVTRQEIQSM